MNEPIISVGIKRKKEIEIIFWGKFTNENRNISFEDETKFFLKNGAIFAENHQNTFEIKNGDVFSPEEFIFNSFVVQDVVIGKEFHWERQQNQQFFGSLKIVINKTELEIINILSIEKYLESVISSEMNPEAPMALLKAEAVIARSWAISQMMKKQINHIKEQKFDNENEKITWTESEGHEKYNVCSDDHCQRYQGIIDKRNARAEIAVSETKGLCLIYGNEICDARYSKCCGGVTETYENVWSNEEIPYLNSIEDIDLATEFSGTNLTMENNAIEWIKGNPESFCNTNNENLLKTILKDYDNETKNFYRWKEELTQSEIKELISAKTGIDFGNILDLIPLERGKSGRIVRLKIIGTKKEKIFGKELEIRKILSKSHLYSSAFFVEKKIIIENVPQVFVLRGAGWGHGVGLCQIGAAVMSNKGYEFDEILNHYFPNAQIKKLF
jgi:SpoIID/LytB domain protein